MMKSGDNEIVELINRRRHQILVHSYIYYELNDNIIPDSQWSEWAVELDELQQKYPELAAKAGLHEEFQDFDPSSGFNLPYRHPLIIAKGKKLLDEHIKRGRPSYAKPEHEAKEVEQEKKDENPFLRDYQADAVNRMCNGCVLNGGVGSGKSRTGLYYYFKEQGGSFVNHKYVEMKNPQDLYIITTPKKRDDMEWVGELANFRMSPYPELNMYYNKIVVDSWQNIKKYVDVCNAFFIFDEQKVCGFGAWGKTFLKIARKNNWILLSATAGDKWEDYITVFMANGFYRTKREFTDQHIVYNPHIKKFPSIMRYENVGRLIRLRNRILIEMDFERHTVRHDEPVWVEYDIRKYKDMFKTRTNPYVQGFIPCSGADVGAMLVGRDIRIQDVTPIMEGWYYEPQNGDYVQFVNKPIKTAAELCYTARKIVNSDESRQVAMLELFERHPKMIIFYNYDYERDILKNLYYGDNIPVAEWNGHAHEEMPEGDTWVYLVQYTAGCEGWNCITTDTIVFYSQTYSYKTLEQARGRIDRLNTPFTNLYYYHLKSRSTIDLAISKALSEKKLFNEGRWAKW